MLAKTFLPLLLSGTAYAAATASCSTEIQNAITSQTAIANTNCEIAQLLAAGIELNIVDQIQEQQALAKVKAVLQCKPVNSAAFTLAKSQLLNAVQAGISIRKTNQLIAPSGNAAIDGLNTVANAQAAELNLTQSLTGNPTTDLPIVAKLSDDFAAGIKQNKANAVAATKGCKTSSKST